jgi:hypothetical protein
MENKYKEFVFDQLYGLIEGSANSLEVIMTHEFEEKFKHEPDLIKVTETNRRIVDENLPNGFLFSSFTVVLVINNEEYTLTRDWAEEYEINKKNNFKSDN